MNYLKKLLTGIIISFLSLFILLFITTWLNYLNLISYNTLKIASMIIPIISLIFGGFYLGRKATKNGYLEGIKLGLIVCLIILIVNLIINEINLKDLIFYLILTASSIFGSMAGINTKKS